MTVELNDGPNRGATDWIRTVTNADFEQLVLNDDGPVVAEFMSYGCQYCRALEPILQEIAEKLATSEKIFRVNVPVEEELSTSYGIHGTPTLVMFLGGREVGRIEGPSPQIATVLAAVTQPFQG